jgi:hypothetical protein
MIILYSAMESARALLRIPKHNRTTDAHEPDLYPNAKTIDDSFSWQPDPGIDWRSVLHLVEQHANSERSASGFLP